MSKLQHWATLIGIAAIWGSSFILIKKGLIAFSAPQVGALRILIAALVLSPLAFGRLQELKKKDIIPIFVVGWIGSGIPAFLFSLAQTQVESAPAAILNSLVPLNTFLIGVLFFGRIFKWSKLVGVVIGMLGALLLLLWGGGAVGSIQFNYYALLILMASVCYATSVNTVQRYCQHIHTYTLTSAAFLSVSPLMLMVLLSGDFSQRLVEVEGAWFSFGAIALLAVFGTALASLVFFNLTQKTSALFASSVTYLIPFFALIWGIWDGEAIGLQHLGGLALILVGVYVASK